METVRRTYKDPEYLRNPIAPYESAKRKMEDQDRRAFEAKKVALDTKRT